MYNVFKNENKRRPSDVLHGREWWRKNGTIIAMYGIKIHPIRDLNCSWFDINKTQKLIWLCLLRGVDPEVCNLVQQKDSQASYWCPWSFIYLYIYAETYLCFHKAWKLKRPKSLQCKYLRPETVSSRKVKN